MFEQEKLDKRIQETEKEFYQIFEAAVRSDEEDIIFDLRDF